MTDTETDFTARGAANIRTGYRSDPRSRGLEAMAAVSLSGDCVRDVAGVQVGRIEGVMLDATRDQIAYAILSLVGPPGSDSWRYAVPWSAIIVDSDQACLVLNVPREYIEHAPGFHRNCWPSITDSSWRETIDSYYGVAPGPAK